jgi:hypothetical protein
MKKLFMFLCIVIMLFGIVGCPDDNEDPPPRAFTSNAVNSPQVGGDTQVVMALLRSPNLLHFY